MSEFAKSTFGRCKSCEEMNKYQAHLASKRKFTSGDPITTLDDLLSQEWVMTQGRTKHIKVIRNMQMETVIRWLKAGFFCKAIRKVDVT